MEFSCCTNRKKSNDKLNKLSEPNWLCNRNNSLELIQNFNESVEIECSYILCGKKGIRPLQRQATIGNNIYYFCSTSCWEEWLRNYDIKNYAFSPSSLKSPNIIKNCNQIEDRIPPLFI
jgi:hypothetical protein